MKIAQTAVLIDALHGHATVHSLHDDPRQAKEQAELLDDAIVRAVVGKVAEGERVRFSSTECGA